KLLQHLLAPEDYFILDEMGNSLIVQSADSDFLGWTIISTIPRSVYDASISVYITITLSLLGLFIIFSFYLARWVARIVTKPINTLSSVLSEAEHAEDLLDINLTGGNQELLEIANVQQKLNEFAVRSRQLMSDLKKANNNQDIANEQLLDLNVNLEKIVASKTKELKIALTKANDASDEAEQAAHAKADFLATMSHEIRTPMNGVLGTAELLNVTSLTVTQKEYVDTILRSGNLLLTIINEILDFSKLEAGKVELEIVPFDLEHLLHQILEVMGRSLTKNIELILDYPATIPNVFRGDPSRLSQVFFNLVDNAIKFTERGSVTIVVRFEGQTLSVEIRDTGIGITEEQKKTLFRSFNQADTSTTRKYGGTGLGLAISKNLINLMNGEITIESEYGKQTNFIITLNLAAEIKPEPEKIFDEIIILIVESNAEHFTMYADLLHYYGASVDQCLEIESLTDTLVYRIAKGSRVDLVLISDNISADDERKYGTELRDHAKLKDIPIVILSPASNKASLQHYFASGFSAYLTKPIRSDLFVSVLSASLENKDATSLITNHSLPNHSQSDSIDIQFSGHILLVEDVLTNQIVAKTMLSNMGLTVDLAEDGLQAIANWKKNHYDLIFMDCRMPNMDGYQATRHIRTKEHSRKTPIIALTANVTEKDRAKCFEAGMDAMVTKPFKPSDLQKALSKWLDSEAKTIIDSGKGQSEPVATSVIDHEMFEETQQALGDAFPKLVDSIFADADKIFEKLSNWTDYLDNEGLAIFPHSLKSASAYIGATKLNQLAYDCESDARAGNVEKALSYLSEMNAAYEDVIRELALLGYDKHG
ncbi:MAG: signal transduction histidine kinase/CheY-like chemotaxis protein, partial [Arenicella sp.]